MNDVGQSFNKFVNAGIELEKSRKHQKRKLLKDIVVFVIFFALSIYIMIWFWNIHPILGLLALGGFVWLAKNKIESGYYFG